MSLGYALDSPHALLAVAFRGNWVVGQFDSHSHRGFSPVPHIGSELSSRFNGFLPTINGNRLNGSVLLKRARTTGLKPRCE